MNTTSGQLLWGIYSALFFYLAPGTAAGIFWLYANRIQHSAIKPKLLKTRAGDGFVKPVTKTPAWV
jgi:hypothetical protein